MIEENELELIDDSNIISFKNNKFLVQDKLDKEKDSQKAFDNMTKVQKSFLLKKNELFFEEYKKIYSKNIILKNKLNEILNEKKRLNQLIIKLEQQMNLSKNKNNGIKNDNLNNDGSMSKIEPYRKIKRKRRKKCEIKNIYKCSFHNCKKSYPTKGSLNMHIKLKHQKEKFYSLENENKI